MKMNGKKSMIIAFMVMSLLFYYIFTSMVSTTIQILYSLYSMYIAGGDGQPYVNIVLVTGICAGLYIPIVYSLFFQKDGKRNGSAFGLVWLIPLGAALCLVLNILISVSGISRLFDTYDQLAKQIYNGNLIIEILSIGVVAPITEELIFRGVMYKGLRTFFRPLWAVVLSAVFFGLYHGNVVQFLYAGTLGAFMAMVYERYRHIIAPILVHMSANIMSILSTDAKPVRHFLSIEAGTVFLLALIALGLIAAPILISRLVPSTKNAAEKKPKEPAERKEEVQQEPPENR